MSRVISPSQVEKFYEQFFSSLKSIKQLVGRPLTLAEKILFTHLANGSANNVERGKTILYLRPDRVIMQDATAQMALLQFITSGRESSQVPASVHCDHLIRASEGSHRDLLKAIDENKEVYDFLSSASKKFGINFWGPGAGIIHQVVLEKYAHPAALIIGTDSHTPNAGGLGCLAIGVGGADAAEVMAGLPWTLLAPKLIGVHLTGSLSSWVSPKDVILKVASILTVKGGTGKILEYFGPGVRSISATGRATITNMGAELGATTSIFPCDENTLKYLELTERKFVADLISKHLSELQADPSVLDHPEDFFDEILEINLNDLEVGWVGPHTPDLFTPVSKMRDFLTSNGYPREIRYALLGSCTNSSYEDLSRAASIAKQAASAGLKVKIPLLITPGSDQILKTIERDGILDIFFSVDAQLLANACGPCIGMWDRKDIKKGELNTIVTSYNRNFKKRNDGNEETLAFIGSPELVTAIAFFGTLDANPLTDSIPVNSHHFKFKEPIGSFAPEKGFVISYDGYQPPELDPQKRSTIQIIIDPGSERLALLPEFEPWDGKDFEDLIVLFKAVGKCTTDHISPAGPWLRYRGHLDKISNNLLLGAYNAFTNSTGQSLNLLTGQVSTPSEVARHYKEANISWVIVGEENYGEGSSREHAAMTPRYLGCKAVIGKSFARIHETNLKKQGVLPLTFCNPSDYDLITQNSRLCILGLQNLSESNKLKCVIKNEGQSVEIILQHSLADEEIEWFKKGSALNMFKK